MNKKFMAVAVVAGVLAARLAFAAPNEGRAVLIEGKSQVSAAKCVGVCMPMAFQDNGTFDSGKTPPKKGSGIAIANYGGKKPDNGSVKKKADDGNTMLGAARQVVHKATTTPMPAAVLLMDSSSASAKWTSDHTRALTPAIGQLLSRFMHGAHVDDSRFSTTGNYSIAIAGAENSMVVSYDAGIPPVVTPAAYAAFRFGEMSARHAVYTGLAEPATWRI